MLAGGGLCPAAPRGLGETPFASGSIAAASTSWEDLPVWELGPVSPNIHPRHLTGSNGDRGRFCNKLMPFSCLT